MLSQTIEDSDGLEATRPEHAPSSQPPRFSRKRKLIHLAKRLSHGAEAAASFVLPVLPNRRVAGEVRVGDHTVRYYKHWPKDDRLIAEWDALSKQVPGGTAFQSPYWQQAASVIPDALGTLRLMTVYDGRRLVAAFPLERRWGGHWRTVDTTSTAHHDPLVHPDNAEQTLDALFRGLAQMDRSLRSICFQLLSPGAPALPIIAAVASAAGFTLRDQALTSQDTTIELAPTWEQYLDRLEGHDRRELRRKIRKAEEKAGATMVVCDTADTVAEALPRVLDLMQLETANSKGRKTRWVFRRHMKIAAPPLARDGRLVVFKLMIGGKLAAGNIALPHGTRQLMWNGAKSHDFDPWSPGIVLWGMIIRRACEQGLARLELLRGLSTYKYELGAAERPLHKVTVARR